MDKILGVVFGLVVLVGGWAIYTKCSNRLCLVSATPINPAVISAEELESKNNKIAALEETVASKDSLYQEALKKKENLFYENLDLKAELKKMTAGVEEQRSEHLKKNAQIEELKNRIAVLKAAMVSSHNSMAKVIEQIQKDLPKE